MKVLIVDDDKSTLLLFKLLLTRAGFRVMSASDATSGLAALRRSRFDWLIVDGQISPIDGLELSSIAKQVQPDIAVVMISGVYERRDILAHPIQKLFRKPVDVDELIAYLTRA